MFIRICPLNLYLYFRISHLTQANEPSSFCLIEQKYKKKKKPITTERKYRLKEVHGHAS